MMIYVRSSRIRLFVIFLHSSEPQHQQSMNLAQQEGPKISVNIAVIYTVFQKCSPFWVSL